MPGWSASVPQGHLLGIILETRSGLWWGDRTLRDKRNVDTTSLPRGEKVRATCRVCPRGNDYEASRAMVAAKLTEARNVRAERTTLIFG
jgi:hypothetical protein